MTVLNLESGTMQCIADDVTKVPDPVAVYIEPISMDRSHNCIWIGGAYGLGKLESGKDSLRYLLPVGIQEHLPLPKGIIDILVDNRDANILWLGTVNGLFSYQIVQNSYEHHPSPYADKYVIMDLYQDAQGDLWIAGDARPDPQRDRLMVYSPEKKSWIRYPLSLAIGSEEVNVGEVYFIHPSSEENLLWICTRKSVGVLNTQSGDFDAWTYDPAKPDGLLPHEIFRAMLSDRHGRLWVSSWDGVQYAKSAFMTSDNRANKVRTAITEIRVSNARADMLKPLLYTTELTLQKDQRDITIRYVLPNPLDAKNVTYTYQLEGWDRGWTSTDQRLVQYSRLRGGNYTFLVRSRERDGEWGEITRLPVSIEKTLTEYATFWILVVLLGGGLVIGTTRYFIARTRREEQLKTEFNKKVSEIQMQALRAQMNPHFLFNSLNSIKYYALSKDKDSTAEYLTKFALLVRTILQNSKSHTISLKDELEALRLYIEIEHLRLEGKFAYHIDIDSSIRVEQAQIPPMILQPFVENAIWHGLMHIPSGGKLLVQVKDLGTQIQCIIEDNGIGRAKAKEIQQNGAGHKKSLGIQITGDRIALINRIYGIDTQVHVIDLHDEKAEATGTRVVITIPLINENET